VETVEKTKTEQTKATTTTLLMRVQACQRSALPQTVVLIRPEMPVQAPVG